MRRVVAVAAAAWLLCTGGAAAQALQADLSTHSISITSSYVGADLVLFGVREGVGDIVVVVRGPSLQASVRRMGRVAGLWLNRASVEFGGVPGFYAVATSGDLAGIGGEALLADEQIGAGWLRFAAEDGRDVTSADDEFAAALVRDRQRRGLYPADPQAVTFVGQSLFRTDFHLPASAPVGSYTATTYLLHEGQVVATDVVALSVDKTGLGQAVYYYAHEQPVAYGVLAVLLALVAGWIAAVAFRRN
jgi:uncharacterized protein (TIGR02186 family)